MNNDDGLRYAIAIDFDGCICENAYPEIGAPKMEVIDAAIAAQKNGAALILWTCRVGSYLEKAVQFCKQHSLVFDAINENLQERIQAYGSDSRKVSADEYWDDKSMLIPS